MIKKIIEAICDNCGTGIYHLPENISCKEFIKILKQRNIAFVKSNKIFCDEQCYNEWKANNDSRFK